MNSHYQLYGTLPLNGDQFRLMTLQHGQWDESIVCHLTVHEFTAQPGFEALSYTWGNDQSSKGITINGASVTIGANLETALRYIRSPDEPRILWIDALCINQGDELEKGHQVQKMCQVFSTATNVLAWLGPPLRDGERALSDIRRIGETLSPIYRGEANENGILTNDEKGWNELKNLSPSHIKKLGLDMESMDWDAIWDLCDRPFWRRIWIIQELVLSGNVMSDISNNRCIAGCGPEWASLPILSTFVFTFGLMRGNTSWINENMSRPLQLFRTRGPPAIEAMFRLIWSFDTVFDQDKKDRSLVNLMRLSRNFQATDPRDKLYGLLGIVKDYGIVVDYSLDPTEVYQQWVKSWIEKEGNLHCILGNRALPNDFGPSWLPELSNSLLDGFAFENLMHIAFQKATYKQPAGVSFSRDSDIMMARGISLGKIDHVIGPFWGNKKSRHDVEMTGKVNTVTDFATMFFALGNLHSSLPQNAQDDVWRACILDSDTSNRSSIVTPAPDQFQHLWHVLLGQEEIDEDFEPHLEKKERLKRYTEPLAKSLGHALCSDRCFFVTENLHMGVGPCTTRVGDEAVLLFGSPLCFILRPDKQGYRLVGDGYVQGVDPYSFPVLEDEKNFSLRDFMIY